MPDDEAPAETRIPLLSGADENNENDEWLREDDMHTADIIRDSPDRVVRYIERHGLRKLGEFDEEDEVVLAALGEDPLLTAGTNEKYVDWRALWARRLKEAAAAHKVRRVRTPGWRMKLTVDAYMVSIRDAAAPGARGILEPLLRRYEAGAVSAGVFGLPAVQAVIHFKWTTWARTLILAQLPVYLIWLLAYTAFVLLFQDEDVHMPLRDLLNTRRGQAEAALLGVGLVGMLPFLYIELCTIIAWGRKWFGTWNFIDAGTYINQVVITVLWVERSAVDSQFMSAIMAVQCVLLWWRLQYFSRVFRPTRTSFVDAIKSVLGDAKYFVFFLMLVLFSFSLAFYTLFRLDQDQVEEFSDIWRALVSTFSFMIGGFDQKLFWQSHNPQTATILFVLFEFVMAVILLNLLIAILTNAMQKVDDGSRTTFLANQAAFIDEMEVVLPKWVLQNPTWFPHYVHILRVDLPDKPEAPPEKPKSDDDRKKEKEEAGDGGQAVAAALQRLEAKLEEVLSANRGILEANKSLQERLSGLESSLASHASAAQAGANQQPPPALAGGGASATGQQPSSMGFPPTKADASAAGDSPRAPTEAFGGGGDQASEGSLDRRSGGGILSGVVGYGKSVVRSVLRTDDGESSHRHTESDE